MDNQDFKYIFDILAKANNFEKAFGSWIKESSECIIVLDLQKSNFGNYFELNIKIFVQGMFGNKYVINKDIVKKHIGDVFARQPNNFKGTLDFDTSMHDEKRKEKLERLFSEFVVPFTNKTLSKSGIIYLANKGEITLLPAIKKELL